MGATLGSSFYEVVSSTSWREAESLAQSLGGNLVAINDENENNFILNEFSSNTLGSSRGGLWIGLSADLDGNFSWSNGDPYDYANFTPGSGLISDYRPYIGNRSAVDGQYVHMVGAYARQVGFLGESPGDWNDVPNNPTQDIAWGAMYEINKGIAEIPLSYFSVSDLTIEEGNKGKVTIMRTGGTQSIQTLTLSTSDGTAVGGDDYVRKTKTLVFAAGETSKTVTIASKEDNLVEADETFTLTLSASDTDAVPAQIKDGTATVKITDNDKIPASYFSISDLTLEEGEKGKVTISRTGGTQSIQTLTLSTSDGTAVGGDDYVRKTKTLVFAAGETSKTVVIASKDDDLVEGDETFAVTLSVSGTDVVPAQISDGTAIVTITDNDEEEPRNNVNGNRNNLIDGNNSTIINNVINNINNSVTNSSTIIDNSTSSTFVDNSTNNTLINSGNTNIDSSTTNIDNSQRFEITALTSKYDNTMIRIRDQQGKFQDFYKPVDTQDAGTEQSDFLEGVIGAAVNEYLEGGAGDDVLMGRQGGDVLSGGSGNDLIRAGHGRDVITGGDGGDTLFGGFGHNIFTGEKDGEVDTISFKSDQHLWNWLYGKAGNNTDGSKLDVIHSLDANDKIQIQGVETSDLTFEAIDNFASPTGNYSGIGIYSEGFLEAIYTGGDLNASQLKSMTVGVDV